MTKPKRKLHKYTKDEVDGIRKDIDKLSFRKVAAKYKVPVSSVHRITSKPEMRRNCGAPTALTEEEEKLVVTAVLTALTT